MRRLRSPASLGCSLRLALALLMLQLVLVLVMFLALRGQTAGWAHGQVGGAEGASRTGEARAAIFPFLFSSNGLNG